MTLEAVVFPQDILCKDYLYSLVEIDTNKSEGSCSHNNYGCQTNEDLFGIINNNINQNIYANWDSSSPSMMQNGKDQWDSNSSLETSNLPPFDVEATTTSRRRKRRRATSPKKEEEIESQRMTHIAVERNRRKQMNEYLAVLRSMMPRSYAKRGDQASIVGGAINFLKELEQHLQSMKGQKKINQKQHEYGYGSSSSPFAEFFMFPQYSTCDEPQNNTCYPANQMNQSRAMADIEVSLVDSHANIKIMLKKRQGQVMKMVVGLQNLGFNILHLNVSTVDDFVLVSVSVKVEEGCQLNTVDDIATAVNQLSCRIHVEAIL
ncbi:transcription factor bHLH96-like [Trifolium pratense]|uniref:transcription factor bHLH96-like n=1 Tax=Trifolium pratense TaxID=57577 RepID=UPI001E6975A8|nr:transcription factor bHLH96-like [Trifolium pratense]